MKQSLFGLLKQNIAQLKINSPHFCKNTPNLCTAYEKVGESFLFDRKKV